MNTKVFKIQSGHVRSDADLTVLELEHLFGLAAEIKSQPEAFSASFNPATSVAFYTEKATFRTAFTFKLAPPQLGGTVATVPAGTFDREPLDHAAGCLGRWVKVIVARVKDQKTVDELALSSGVPVVNALSNLWHPCQIFGDLAFLQSHWGALRAKKIAFVGDANSNVARSLMYTAVRLGVRVSIGAHEHYHPDSEFLEMARAQALNGGRITLQVDPGVAVRGADAVYTDTWVSMGSEAEKEARLSAFTGYCVDEALFALAKPTAVFMHCLPTKNQENSPGMIRHPRSVVFDQAEWRLHSQKAMLLMLVNGK